MTGDRDRLGPVVPVRALTPLPLQPESIIVRWYIVYRHGRNPINQSPDNDLPDKMAVARLRAQNAEAACQQAAEVMLAGNQYLSAEPAEDVDAKESALNLTARA